MSNTSALQPAKINGAARGATSVGLGAPAGADIVTDGGTSGTDTIRSCECRRGEGGVCPSVGSPTSVPCTHSAVGDHKEIAGRSLLLTRPYESSLSAAQGKEADCLQSLLPSQQ